MRTMCASDEPPQPVGSVPSGVTTSNSSDHTLVIHEQTPPDREFELRDRVVVEGSGWISGRRRAGGSVVEYTVQLDGGGSIRVQPGQVRAT